MSILRCLPSQPTSLRTCPSLWCNFPSATVPSPVPVDTTMYFALGTVSRMTKNDPQSSIPLPHNG